MELKKNINITTLLPKEVIAKNDKAVELVEYYTKVSGIIERTHIAMGKKTTFKLTNSSTNSEKLNANVFASTF